jgi:hypothetical protein
MMRNPADNSLKKKVTTEVTAGAPNHLSCISNSKC